MLEQRRSHRRLILSISLSTAVLAALLTLAPGFVIQNPCSDLRCREAPDIIDVNIASRSSELVLESALPANKVSAIPGKPQQPQPEQVETAQHETAAEVGVEQRPDITSARSWHEIARKSASQSMNDRLAREKTRKSMWRSTGSVMFRDTGEFDFHEPATVIADLEFRIPVGILGIGITIGGCFIGIPLAGIPVEKRTAGPTVIYCTDIYE